MLPDSHTSRCELLRVDVAPRPPEVLTGGRLPRDVFLGSKPTGVPLSLGTVPSALRHENVARWSTTGTWFLELLFFLTLGEVRPSLVL